MTEAVLGLHPAQAGDGQRIVAMVLAAIVPEGMAHIDAAMGIGQAGDEEVFVGKDVRVAGLAGQHSLAGGAEIGRASCRERLCQHGSCTVYAASRDRKSTNSNLLRYP